MTARNDSEESSTRRAEAPGLEGNFDRSTRN
jgi:hypothetical protein